MWRSYFYAGLLALLLMGAAKASSSSQADSRLKLQVRLLNHLTSYSSRPGTPFRCIVVAPYETGGQTLIPAGSVVFGVVQRAVSVHLGLIHERAALDLSFSSYELPDGERFPLTAKLADIENAREQVTRTGEIKGILAARKPEQILNGFWERPALNMLYRPLEGLTGVGQELLERFPLGPAAPAVVLGLRCLVLHFPEPEIHLVPGTDLELNVDFANSEFVRHPAPPARAAEPVLNNWIRNQPLTVDLANGHVAADLMNVAFIGSEEELTNAFLAAGWYRAEPSNFRSMSHVYAAFDEKKGYHQAPVSRLLYEGRAPELVFEKSFDTIAKRHHVRIWNAGTFEGEPVWMGAATHDIGIAFHRRLFPFSHAIDTRLDWEREKIVADLVFTGCSMEPVYADAGADNRDVRTNSIFTDGRVAVMTLRSCEQPLHDMTDDGPPPPGNRASRFARRIILESRDYLFRENAYYFTYELIRQALRHSSPD